MCILGLMECCSSMGCLAQLRLCEDQAELPMYLVISKQLWIFACHSGRFGAGAASFIFEGCCRIPPTWIK